jgi:hypothetical protein
MLLLAVLATLTQGSMVLVARQPESSTKSNTIGHVYRRLAEISQRKTGRTFSNSTSLDKSFSGVTLFRM